MPFDNSLRGHQGFITAGLLLDDDCWILVYSSVVFVAQQATCYLLDIEQPRF